MFLFLSPVPQLFCSMSATFTLNFFRSGIQFGSWGAFQLPGLLNFGEFKVCFALPPRISSSTRDSRSLVRHQREVIGSVRTASGGVSEPRWSPAPAARSARHWLSRRGGASRVSSPLCPFLFSWALWFFVSLSLTPSLSALTPIKNVTSGQLWIWVSSS